ncbi:hypothetical protein N2152v2_007989 [Parachlorella kessleri]
MSAYKPVALAQACLSRHSSWKLSAVRPDDQPAPSQSFSDFPCIPAAAPTAPLDHSAHQLDLAYLTSTSWASSATCAPEQEASGCPSSNSSCAAITSYPAPLLDVAGLLTSGAHLRSTWDGCTCLILGTPAPAPPSLGHKYSAACQALVLRAGCLLTYAAVARSEPESSAAAAADTVGDSCDAMPATQPASISSDSDTWTMQYWMWCADAAAALGKPRTYAASV